MEYRPLTSKTNQTEELSRSYIRDSVFVFDLSDNRRAASALLWETRQPSSRHPSLTNDLRDYSLELDDNCSIFLLGNAELKPKPVTYFAKPIAIQNDALIGREFSFVEPDDHWVSKVTSSKFLNSFEFGGDSIIIEWQCSLSDINTGDATIERITELRYGKEFEYLEPDLRLVSFVTLSGAVESSPLFVKTESNRVIVKAFLGKLNRWAEYEYSFH